jgi:DNA polymerase-3 subunit gamma/tau
MGQALYRKYRSRSLSEIVGQEHVTETLRRAIEMGRVSHAYLFTGPRGVGKTSIARILAHDLNGVAYNDESSHLDIIEIDAASNGGVEEVRELRDKVYITPSSGKYKVYIIDEVHMMTSSAFNALLKTLEEPPAHTIFILATTEAHKLPATIVSRTQRFTFKPIPVEKMTAHLRHIAIEEKIDVTDDALDLIAIHSEGSFRDAISILDQAASSSTKLGRTEIETLLGIPSEAHVHSIVEALIAHDTVNIVSNLAAARQAGYQASLLAKQLGGALRLQLLDPTSSLAKSSTLILLARLLDVPTSARADQMLEIVLLEAVFIGIPEPIAAAPSIVPRPSLVTTVQAQKTVTPLESSPSHQALADPSQPQPDKTISAEDSSSHVMDVAGWQVVLDNLKKEYNTLYGIIRMAQPEFTPGHITLTFGFAFHQKRANDPKNKKIITTTIEALTGQRIAIDCKYDKTISPPGPIVGSPATSLPNPEAGGALGAVSAIFGGGEVVKPN